MTPAREIIDRTTTIIARAALQRDDARTLSRYARFLHSITDRILARGVDAATANRMTTVGNATDAKYDQDSRTCQ